MNEVMNEGNADEVLGEVEKRGCEEFRLVLATFKSDKKTPVTDTWLRTM
jgi:hypothetical protein